MMTTTRTKTVDPSGFEFRFNGRLYFIGDDLGAYVRDGEGLHELSYDELSVVMDDFLEE